MKTNKTKKSILPKVKIENGMKFIHNGKYYDFCGRVNTIDSFHNYGNKQNIKFY